MAAALQSRAGDCLLHGRHHELAADCRRAVSDWYARHDPQRSLGHDLVVVMQTSGYQRVYEAAVARKAYELGHCPDCARLGAACARCDPPTDDQFGLAG